MSFQKINLALLLKCLLLSLEICALADCVLVWYSISVRVLLFSFGIAAVFAVVVLFSIIFKFPHILTRVLTVFILTGIVIAFLSHRWFVGESTSMQFQYAANSMDKQQLFGGKKVMLIVPHEDDDLNLLSGTLDEYLRYQSDFYVVFMTNGDYHGIKNGETRIAEARALYRYLGLPEDHLIFLGYGDQLNTAGVHIYNLTDPDEVVISSAGRTATYCTTDHPAFREGQLYTRNNLLQDMKNVILNIMPEMIVCVDDDLHPDHKACSLFFETAMGEILKEIQDYSPDVLKGFAYSTAWEAEPDFYSTNIKSTQNPYERENRQDPAIYQWDERVRLPIRSGSISHSLFSSELFKELSFYDSQDTNRAASIINGDKVFWRRSTNSLLRYAEIEVSSGNETLLSDFKILDSNAVMDLKHLSCDGTWIPEDNDDEKTVRISFESPVDVIEIVLYDNPSTCDNILNLSVAFNDGTVLKTGPLEPSGAATHILSNKKKLTVFNFRLLKKRASPPLNQSSSAYMPRPSS